MRTAIASSADFFDILIRIQDENEDKYPTSKRKNVIV